VGRALDCVGEVGEQFLHYLPPSSDSFVLIWPSGNGPM
jgi:hypothetical protein